MEGRPSVLVCVLYVGEPSLMEAIRSIEAQRDVDVRIIVIGHHPKQQAHERLFKTLNAFRDEHDAMLFIGSDMKIASDRLLFTLTDFYRTFPDVDQIVLGVDDWFSGEQILGVHSWRRGVKHSTSPHRLFTDVVDNSSRRKFKLARPRTPLILHGEAPSDLQAIRYGAQRAMKAASSGKESRWERLGSFVRFAQTAPTPQRLLAAAAIALALEDAEFGMRCLSGDRPLSVEDLEAVRARSGVEDLLDSLEKLVSDEPSRDRLRRERQEAAPARSRQSVLRRIRSSRRSGRAFEGAPQESMERAFYDLLGA